MATCLQCGTAIDAQRKYCSYRCAGLARRIKSTSCPQCGNTFKPKRKHQTYCSKRCAGIARRTLAIARCAKCGKLTKRGYKYCSRTCAQLARRKQDSKHCEQCGKVFYKAVNSGQHGWVRRRFCSRKCRDKSFKHRVYFVCKGCGKSIETTPSRVERRKFCAACNFKVAHRERILTSNKRLGGDMKKRCLREKIYRSYCEICNYTRFIELAHVIRVCNGGTMEPVNIITMCPNHHRLFDRGLLTAAEYATIASRVAAARAHFSAKHASA